MKLIIVRHGESLANTQMLFEGSSHGELTELGIQQAKKVGLRLKNEKIDIAYVSDLKRAQDTSAEILKFHVDTPVIPTEELRERHYGTLESVERDIYQHVCDNS
ncbi:MAG: histidine phosphatase family protein [Candidatus Aenigmarchaeota archaeon]|nr:histidine phosphatase family protein [Candidatus Aenigmarchaeota archaeon]